jgi:carbonic anhydrase
MPAALLRKTHYAHWWYRIIFWAPRKSVVINHTDCGLMHTSEQDLRDRIQRHTGTAAISPASFHTFQNVEENVRHQLQKLRAHPWIPESVAVRGFVYDVTSGASP